MDRLVEELSARLHDVYQVEAHRRGDVRHADRYEDLSDDTKEWDRVLARWVLTHFVPTFDWPVDDVPSATEVAPRLSPRTKAAAAREEGV